MRAKNTSDMHDSEPETIVLKSMPEIFSDKLKEIGIESRAKEIATDEVEKGDYYGRHFTQAPRMITNKGCLEIKGANIDLVQIIQKG